MDWLILLILKIYCIFDDIFGSAFNFAVYSTYIYANYTDCKKDRAPQKEHGGHQCRPAWNIYPHIFGDNDYHKICKRPKGNQKTEKE